MSWRLRRRALGSYVLQHKSIEYHFIPARTLVWLLVGLVALEGIRWLAALPLPAGLRRWQAMASRYRVLLLCLVAVLPFYRLADRTVLDERRVDDSMRALAAVLEANRIGPRIAVVRHQCLPCLSSVALSRDPAGLALRSALDDPVDRPAGPGRAGGRA